MIPHDCQPAQDCCNVLFEVCELLAAQAADAVNQCATDECGSVAHRVTHGAPVGPKDYVAAWVRTTNPTSRTSRFPRVTATFGLRLLESGFPVAEGDAGGLSIPSNDEWTNASTHSFAHGEAILRYLTGATINGLDAGSLDRHIDCNSGELGRMEVVAPTGGVGGWDYIVSFRVTL